MARMTASLLASLSILISPAFGAPDPAIADRAVDAVLAAEDNGTRFYWGLQDGRMLQQALEWQAGGQKERALAAARMQFIICPLDPARIDLAVRVVQEALVSVDGNDERAKLFGEYVKVGPAGPDGVVGTADDLTNPIRDVSLAEFERPAEYYAEFDRVIDERANVSATWERAWYETQKAFERLSGGRFDEAAAMLAATLGEVATLPHRNDGDSWELQRAQDIVDRIKAGLGVAYRARTGTMGGVEEFVAACMDYATYGPAGKDGHMGTDDDLKSPM